MTENQHAKGPLPKDFNLGRLVEQDTANIGPHEVPKVVDAAETALARERAKEAAEARARYEATHDPLTGLLNRAGFQAAIEGRAERAKSGSFGALFVDLGNFKFVNDSLGHAKGDAALKMVAHRMRDGEFAGRLGGDEFALLVDLQPRPDRVDDPETKDLKPEERLEIVKNRLVDDVMADIARDADLAGSPFNIAVGGAVWQVGQTAEVLLHEADLDMMAHKEEQRARYGAYRKVS